MRKTMAAMAAVAAFGLAGMVPAAAQPMQLEITGADGAPVMGDPAKGAQVFNQCKQCHTIQAGQNRIGPTLYQIIGRQTGTVEGFRYSKANQESGITWTQQELFVYLENPRAKIPGTTMAFAGLKNAEQRANLIAYLIQESNKPAQ